MARLRVQLATTYATEGLNIVTGLVFGVISARALEASGRGQVAAVWTAISIGTLFANLGISKSLIVRLNAQNLGFSSRDYYGGLIVVFPVLCVIGWLVLSLIFPNEPEETRPLLWAIAVVAIPVSIATDLVRTAHRARRRIWVINAATALTAVARVIAVLSLWAIGRVTVTSVLLIELSALVLAGTVAAALLGKNLLRAPNFRKLHGVVLALVGYGFVSQIYGVSFNLINRSNVSFLNIYAGDVATGHFAVASRLAEYIGAFTNVIIFVVVPYIVQYEAKEERFRLAATTSRLSFLILVPAAGCLALVAPALVPLLYGSTFLGAVVPLQIMSAATVCGVLFQLTAVSAIAGGDMRAVALIAISSLCMNVGAMFAFIPLLGAAGAALSALSAHLFALMLHLAYLKHAHGLDPIGFIAPRREEILRLLRGLWREKATGAEVRRHTPGNENSLGRP